MDVVTEVRKGLFHVTLYVDIMVLMSNSIEGILGKFANWKDPLESKSLKSNNQKQN